MNRVAFRYTCTLLEFIWILLRYYPPPSSAGEISQQFDTAVLTEISLLVSDNAATLHVDSEEEGRRVLPGFKFPSTHILITISTFHREHLRVRWTPCLKSRILFEKSDHDTRSLPRPVFQSINIDKHTMDVIRNPLEDSPWFVIYLISILSETFYSQNWIEFSSLEFFLQFQSQRISNRGYKRFS